MLKTNTVQLCQEKRQFRLRQNKKIKITKKLKQEELYQKKHSFESICHAYSQIMHADPFPENVNEEQGIQIIEEFPIRQKHEYLINKCKSGKYDFKRIVQLIEGQKQSKVSEKVAEKQKYEYGRNIIKLKQLDRYNKISNQPYVTEIAKNGISILANFQSGNLAKYYQVQAGQYILFLNNDTNTIGYTQWFEFFIQLNDRNSEEQKEINFTILNIKKPIRFMQNMRLLTRKCKPQCYQDNQWTRNLPFYFFQTNFEAAQSKNYYGISFGILSSHLKNGLFVALSYPYTLSRLFRFFQQLSNFKTHHRLISIGKSTLGNPILLYNICKPQRAQKRIKNIFILARQHASETSSSYICQYMIRNLTSQQSTLAQKIKSQYNWHIIPIANPDGVVHGNSRTTIRGFDMNRCWAPYMLANSVQAYWINQYIEKINPHPEDFFIDIHTHNRQLGCFSYANCLNQFVKVFNMKMASFLDYYYEQKCKIGYDSTKKNTFRVQMQTRFKVKNILTLQTSYYGHFSKDRQQLMPFCVKDYEKMAIAILKTLQYLTNDSVNKKQQVKKQIKTKQARMEAVPVKKVDKKQIQSQSESDTNPQGDYLNQQDRKEIQKVNIIDFDRSSLSKQQKQKRTLSASPCTQQKSNQHDKEKIEKKQNIINLYKAMQIQQQDECVFEQQSIQDMGFLTHSKLKNVCKSIGKDSIYRKRYLLSTVSKKIEKNQLLLSSRATFIQSYMQRKSFKNLFASAQLRNISVSSCKNQTQQRDSLNKMSKTNENKSKKLLKKTNDQFFQKGGKIQNLIFPERMPNREEYQRQMQAINRSLKKKNIGVNNMFVLNIKRNQLKDKESTNKKIDRLCQYVKNADSFSSLL